MMNELNEMKTGVYIHNEDSYTFKFYTDLTTSKKLKFVNSVVDLLVDETHYNSVIRDLVFDFYVVNIMTDIDTTELVKSETFSDDVEEFLLSTNIVDIVKANAFPSLFIELNNAIDDSISYLTGIHKNPLNDSLSSLFYTLEKKIEEVDMSKAMEMANMLNGMTGEFTPESIVNAYLKSDTHKQNLAEVAKSKKNKKNKKHKKNEIKIDENLGEAIRTVVRESKAEKVDG